MRKAIITTIVAGLIGVGVAAPMAAYADTSPPADTSATLAITGGDLTLTAQGSADLGSVAAGQSATSGSLGTVTVTDMRATDGGDWTASAVSTDFTTASGGTGEVIPASSIAYSPGSAVNPSGDASFTAGDGGAMSNVTAVTAFSASSEIGVSAVSWNPNVDFALPSNVVAGTFTGTITHSVA